MHNVQVAAYNDRFEASIVAARLADAGINAYVAVDDLAGNLPIMLLSEGGSRVFVESRHVDRAIREITRVGGHAIDTWAMGARSDVSDLDRSRRVGYVIATILGWGLGYAPWHFFGG